MAKQEQGNTADDALELSRTSSTPTQVGQQALPNDYESPAEPAKNPYIPSIPQDDPSTDTGLDQAEVYEKSQEGTAVTPENPDVSDQDDAVPRTQEKRL